VLHLVEDAKPIANLANLWYTLVTTRLHSGHYYPDDAFAYIVTYSRLARIRRLFSVVHTQYQNPLTIHHNACFCLPSHPCSHFCCACNSRSAYINKHRTVPKRNLWHVQGVLECRLVRRKCVKITIQVLCLHILILSLSLVIKPRERVMAPLTTKRE